MFLSSYRNTGLLSFKSAPINELQSAPISKGFFSNFLLFPACEIKTTKGDCCVFPFTYGFFTYNACTKNIFGDPWCGTKAKVSLITKQPRGRCELYGKMLLPMYWRLQPDDLVMVCQTFFSGFKTSITIELNIYIKYMKKRFMLTYNQHEYTRKTRNCVLKTQRKTERFLSTMLV